MLDSESLKRSYSSTSCAFYSSKSNKLTSLITTLPASNNEDLAKFIEMRLARGSVLSGSGQIATIDLGIEPAHCYFCLLNPSDTGSDDEQFIVSFVTECNRGLDSFRNQLDQYSLRMETSLKADELSDPLQVVKPYLDNWYRECLLFIVNCVLVLGNDSKYVIYNAVSNGQISVDTDDPLFESDIERFHASCTLSALLSQTPDSAESSDTSGSLIDLDAEPHSKTKRMVDILCVTYKERQISFSHQSSTEFCERWAQALLENYAYLAAEEGEVNPLSLKSISETYKLKTIQDMNTLKRLAKEAELDFYSLFRSRVFIRNSGNARILLMHAVNEEQNPESLSILKLLEETTDPGV